MNNGKKVLCSGCNKPIHIDDFGAMLNVNGKQHFFHNNITCLIKLKEYWRRKNDL